MYGESSMRNGFGLRLLHKFLGLPFLSLQKDTLLSLLQRNQREAEVCGLELQEYLVSHRIFFLLQCSQDHRENFISEIRSSRL